MSDLSMNDLYTMSIREQHAEVAMLHLQMNFTKTGYGEAHGFPKEFESGVWKSPGVPRMIRIQDVIHAGAYKKMIKALDPPPSVTLVSVATPFLAREHAKFFFLVYSKKPGVYRKLPGESKIIVCCAGYANVLWEAWNEKIAAQQRGEKGFACPDLYERAVQARALQKEYGQYQKFFNAQRNKLIAKGMEPMTAERHRQAARADLFEELSAKVKRLQALPMPEIEALPPGVIPFKPVLDRNDVPLELLVL